MAVVEVTSFEVREREEAAFQYALTNALPILMRQSGYVSHEFGASIERPGLFWLIVHWERLEDHTEAFRKSAAFEIFVGAFRPFLAKPAAVSHFTPFCLVEAEKADEHVSLTERVGECPCRVRDRVLSDRQVPVIYHFSSSRADIQRGLRASLPR